LKIQNGDVSTRKKTVTPYIPPHRFAITNEMSSLLWISSR